MYIVYYCTAVSNAKTGSPSFCVYPSFVLCLYICIVYWLLPYFVHDSYIHDSYKYFIKSSFLQSIHVKDQFRNRNYW